MLKAFDGGRIFGTVTGGADPTVLALHGWGRSAADFDAALDGLDAVALDLPGFGATPPPPVAWGGAGYAAAVAPVLDAMATPVVVVGHSFGGRVAVHLAATEPDRVAGLVLTGVPLLRPPGRPARRPPLPYRAARAAHRRGLLGEARMEALRRRYGSRDYRAATGVMRAVHVTAVNETYEDVLAQVACPVALVWGAEDPEVPLSVAEALRGHLPQATLHAVAGTGHLVPTSAPGALREAVDHLLAARR